MDISLKKLEKGNKNVEENSRDERYEERNCYCRVSFGNCKKNAKSLRLSDCTCDVLLFSSIFL